MTADLKSCPFCGCKACVKGSSCVDSRLLIGFMRDKLGSDVSQWNAREGAPALSREGGE